MAKAAIAPELHPVPSFIKADAAVKQCPAMVWIGTVLLQCGQPVSDPHIHKANLDGAAISAFVMWKDEPE